MTHLLSRAAVLAVAALGGCGQVAFKRGSGPDDFAAARAACRQQDPAQAAVRACLSSAGWSVTDMDPAPAPNPVPTGPAPLGATAAPEGKVTVGSWWKLGAGTADLQQAAAACAAGLGPDDKPGPGFHLVTRALYECLGAHGWHAAGRPTS